MLPVKSILQFLIVPKPGPTPWAMTSFPHHAIQRLDEKPTRRCTIQDITCDSDGKINRSSSPQGMAYSLPVHTFKTKREILYRSLPCRGLSGNSRRPPQLIFGDTCAVHISVNENGYQIEQVIDGEPVADVARLCGIQPQETLGKP